MRCLLDSRMYLEQSYTPVVQDIQSKLALQALMQCRLFLLSLQILNIASTLLRLYKISELPFLWKPLYQILYIQSKSLLLFLFLSMPLSSFGVYYQAQS